MKLMNPIEHYPDRWRKLKEIKTICDADILVTAPSYESYTYGQLNGFEYCELEGFEYGQLNSLTIESAGHFPSYGVGASAYVHTLQCLWGCIEQELDNNFIIGFGDKVGADDYACSRWEAILGIVPSNKAELEDRQIAIYTRMFHMVPYTYENIQKTLDSILGKGNTLLIPDVEAQTCKVILAVDNRFKFESVKELLDNIIPANMILTVEIDYRTHDDLSKYTHSRLGNYTHEIIKMTEL